MAKRYVDVSLLPILVSSITSLVDGNMPKEADVGEWGSVDASEDTDEYTSYLEEASAVEAISEYKARSYEELRLESGSSVLDAGCGIGDDARELAKLVGSDGTVVGIDNSETMIGTARERAADAPSVSFEVGEVTALDFEADSFDAARADRVFQHLDDPAAALAELLRVTRPGGRIGLSDPDFESLRIDAPGMDAPDDLLEPEHGPSRNPDQGRRLYRLAVDGGLADITIDPVLFVSTDFEFVWQMASLDDWTANMVAAGVIAGTERDDWVGRLEDASEAGRFFAMTPFITVTGTAPDSV